MADPVGSDGVLGVKLAPLLAGVAVAQLPASQVIFAPRLPQKADSACQAIEL